MKQINETTFKSDNGLITFIHGDCMEFMAGCRENEFDLNVSDPPYGINVTKMNMGGRATVKPNKNKDWDSYTPDINWFNLCKRTSVNFIIFGGNYFEWSEIYNPKLKRLRDFKKYHGIIWDKGETMAGRDFSEAEIAYTNLSDGIYKKNPNQPERFHPTQKPIELYRWIFSNYTKPTDKILDCFGGSMSSAIAAHMEGLKMIIIELDKEYFDKATQRFSIYEQQQTLNFE